MHLALALVAGAMATSCGDGRGTDQRARDPQAAAGSILNRLPPAGPDEPDALAVTARANLALSLVDATRLKIARAQLNRLWRLRKTSSADEAAWGLTFRYDDFGDGSVNPVNTKYAYTTAVAALAYLDAFDRTRDRRDLSRATRAAHTIIRRTCCWRQDGAIAVWYSDAAADRRPGLLVYNVSGLTLAVLNRLASAGGPQNVELRRGLARFIRLGQGRGLDITPRDGTRIAPTNWRYSTGLPVPNDLLHEAFIDLGLLSSTSHQDRRLATASLAGIWRTHLQDTGTPRTGTYTEGSRGWGPPSALLAFQMSAFRTRTDALTQALLRRVAPDGRIRGVSDARATPWYALALASSQD